MDSIDEKISWSALEHEGKEKKPDWFWTLGVIAFVGAGICIYVGNYLFALFIILSAIILIYMALRPADMISYELNKDGILIDTLLYPYNKLKGYALDYTTTPQKLVIESQRSFLPVFVIPLQDISAQEVNGYLSTKMTEKEIKIPLAHILVEYFGF